MNEPRKRINPTSSLWNPQRQAEQQLPQSGHTHFSVCHQTTCTKRFLNFGVPVETKHSISGCCNLEEAGCLCPSQRGVQAGAHHLLPTPGFAWPSHCSLQENSRDKVCFQNQGFQACIPTPTCVVPALLTANSD